MTPKWRAIALGLLLLAAGVGFWRVFFSRSDTERWLLALNDAYKTQRPLQSRITGLNHSPFSTTRGPISNLGEDRARDSSAAILVDAVDRERSVESLHAVGRVYLLQKDFDKAISDFEDALKMAPNESRLHSDLGAALFEKGKLERGVDQSGRSETTLASSLEHLNRALELDNPLLDARFNRALVYQTLKLTPQAIADWETYLAQDPHSPWANEAQRYLVEARRPREKLSDSARDLFREFLEAHKAGDQNQLWQIFSKVHSRTGNQITNKLVDGYLKSSLEGRTGEAKEFARALKQLGGIVSERSGDHFTSDLATLYESATQDQLKSLARARDLMNLGHDHYRQAKTDQAIASYAQAKDLFDEVGDVPEALLANFWMGFCYSERADTQGSLSTLDSVKAQCEARHYRWLLGMTHIGLGSVRVRLAQFSKSVDDSWVAYKLSEQAQDKNGKLRSLNMLAALQRNLGKYRQALHLSQQGLDVANEISGDESQLIGFYATSAWSFNSLGHYAVALEYEKQALKLSEVMNNALVQSRYLVQMGLIQAKLKDYDAAIQNIQRGLEIGQSVGQEKSAGEMAAYAKLYLGRTYREAGRFAEALTALNEVALFSEQNDQVWVLHDAHKEQLLTHIAQGQITQASEELTRVLNDYEEQREKILEESNRNSFFDKEQGIYDVAIDFAHSHLTDARQSFAYSESSRARSLLDTSTSAWQVQQDENKGTDLYFSSTLKPASLEELRPHIPEQAQLLQYAVLQDKLIIWYISKDRFESRSVAIGSDELARRVDKLLSIVTRANGDDQQLVRTATELYDVLIQPVSDLLDGKKQLCIVPDKSLNLLPFNLLYSSASRTYLTESFTLSYASSTNTFVRDTKLAQEKRELESERLLSVGNPRFDRTAFPNLEDLPSAAKEATDITTLYDSYSLLLGADATKNAVQAEMRHADVLHLATHYVPDSNSPMLSELVLAPFSKRSSAASAPEGVLQAHEIYQLKPAKSRLVILSACQTAVESYFNGEGAMGLSRPFKAAGVPVVIASLWPVDSEATTDLMVTFHRLRKTGGLSSATALRQAQMQMLKHSNPTFRRPYYWASFALTGGYSEY